MRARLGILLLAPLALACGGDGGGLPTVTRPGVASVTISAPPTTVGAGQILQLTATALDVAGGPVTNPGPVTWSTGASQIATVDQTGKVTTIAPGTTSISARVGTVTGTTSLSVVPAAPAKDTVSTLPESFVPNLLTIPAGSSVVFAFGGGIPHNVIFDRATAGAPADIQIVTNVTVSRAFPTRGSFRYDCTVHPGMRGQVDVQ